MMEAPEPNQSKREPAAPQGDGVNLNSLARIIFELQQKLDAALKTQPSSTTSSPEVLQLQAELKYYLEKDPGAAEEALRLYKAKYANVLVKTTLQKLFRHFGEKEKEYISVDRINRIEQAVNRYCRHHGYKTEEINANGEFKHDADLADVTFERLDEFAKALPAGWAAVEISCLRCLLEFGKREHYLRENPAEGVQRRLTIQEMVEIASKDITVDSNEEVQIALDIAAVFRGGKAGKPGGLLWMVVMRYYGRLRPEAELPNLEPETIQEDGGFRVFSTKTRTMRGSDLPANAMVMLDHYWPDRSTDTAGWRQLWNLIRIAQNRYLRESGQRVPTKRTNRPRHTGCAHGRFLKKKECSFLWKMIMTNGISRDHITASRVEIKRVLSLGCIHTACR